jgi:hypothetical protein
MQQLDARVLEAGGAVSVDLARAQRRRWLVDLARAQRRRWLVGLRWLGRRLGRHWVRLVWVAAWLAAVALALFYTMFFVYGAALCQGAREAMGIQ